MDSRNTVVYMTMSGGWTGAESHCPPLTDVNVHTAMYRRARN